jgi:protein gp37
MSDKSAIEWTDATWNPVTGCTQISPGCDHCYALTFAERFRGVPGHPYEQGFDMRLWPERLALPLGWAKPRRIFVNSMSDLFHQEIPTEYVAAVFDTMTKADWHVFQVLTKRPGRLRRIANGLPWPDHIWAGVSVETNKFVWRADYGRPLFGGI